MPAAEISPERVTVKVNAVVPALPSFCTALVAAMARLVASSFRMVPLAVAVVMVPADGLERVTVKPLSGSTTLSALTLTVMIAVATPAAKETGPLGSTPPEKSAGSAGLPPDPVTA